MSVVGKLRKLSAELGAKREELRISAEQLSFLEQVTEEARIQMLVGQDPLSRREHAERLADLERHRKLHASLERHISELEAQQDELLERM